jgi:hypothetical protein
MGEVYLKSNNIECVNWYKFATVWKIRKQKFHINNSSSSTILLHINVQLMNLAGENSIGDVLMYIGQLARVRISKAISFNSNRHELDCH